MLDQPIVQKFIAGIAATTLVAVGGVGWQTSHKVAVLEHAGADIHEALQDIKADVAVTRDNTASIKTDVAVLKSRTDRLDKLDLEAAARAKPGS